MFRFLAVAVMAAGLAVTGAACGLFCDDADLSCGGSPYRDTASCATSISHACSAVGVWGGVVIGLPALPDGDYALEGSIDGKAWSCPFTVAAGEVTSVCPEGGESWWLPDRDIRLGRAPCSLSLELRSGEEVVASGTFRPDYEWDEPSGEDCGWVATARVQLGEAAGE